MRTLKQQDGVASLISVTLTSFLILVITVAITALMLGELRQAEDAENSVKAYYAAEGGAEDAISYIKTKLTSNPPTKLYDLNQGCGTDNVTAGGGDPVTSGLLTCRNITAYAGDLQSSLEANGAAQFDLTNGVSRVDASVDHFGVEWDSKVDNDAPRVGFFSPPNAPPLFDTSTVINSPPVFEMTLTTYFPNEPARVDPTRSKTLFLTPQCSVSGSSCSPTTANVDYSTANGVVRVFCSSTTADYRCKANINNVAPAGYKTVLNVRARFGAMRYHIYGMKDNYAGTVQIPLKNAQVDVTAKSGDSFRRLTIEVPIRSGAYSGISAIYGDKNLCKDFEVFEDPSANYTQVHQTNCPLDNSGN